MSAPPERHEILFLDPVGGIAGDMFLAALVDLAPELEELLIETVAGIHDLPETVSAGFIDLTRSGGFGRGFRVTDSAEEDHGAHPPDGHQHEHDHDDHHEHPHRHHDGHHHHPHDEDGHHHHHPHDHHHEHVDFPRALEIVAKSELSPGARARAEDIFTHLAGAEGKAHGVPMESVHFHEVGGWDSIVDILLAATAIETLEGTRWQCGPIPIGKGSVHCAHGVLPVPAPATTHLLRGFRVFQDGHLGERVTPTGAAILNHLAPEQLPGIPSAVLLGSGSGYGTRRIEGLSNVLRIFSFEASDAGAADRVAVVEFEVDDQSPEDLAIGIDALRALDEVLDVVQTAVHGKKGRVSVHVRVLATLDGRSTVVDRCLTVTSSIGVRWYVADRATLPRESRSVQVGGRARSVKFVTRPDGRVTGKIEADEIRDAESSYAEREMLRAQVGDGASEQPVSNGSDGGDR